MVFLTLYGDVRMVSPRLHRCPCKSTNGPATVSPLRALIPDYVAPERLYLEARWASLVPYAAAAGLLADILPVTSGANATTLREHVLRVAERVETELAEEQPCFIDGCPADWAVLPIPEGRIVVGLDGGYVRNWQDRKTNFEVIVGQSVPEDRDARYVGLVHGYDRKQKRRLFDVLKSQGLQPNQDVTFLTDGGEEIRALTELVTPESEHVLDWFHITMRVTVLEQYARGVVHHDEAAGQHLLDSLESIKWLLWHGNQHRTKEAIEIFEDETDGLEVDYQNLRKFVRTAHEFAVYSKTNEGSLINYGERYRAGERISSCLAQSTVNAVISKRFAKRQQMQWTKRGAAPTCCYRPEHALSTARSGQCSKDGTQALPTTTPLAPLKPQQHDTPEILDALPTLKWRHFRVARHRRQRSDGPLTRLPEIALMDFPNLPPPEKKNARFFDTDRRHHRDLQPGARTPRSAGRRLRKPSYFDRHY